MTMKILNKIEISKEFKTILIASFIGSMTSFIFAILLFSFQQCLVNRSERNLFISKLIGEIDYNLFVAEQKQEMYTSLLTPLSENIDRIPMKEKYKARQKIIYDNRLLSYKSDMIDKSFQNGIIYEFLDSPKASLLLIQIIRLKEYENNLIDYISNTNVAFIDDKQIDYFLAQIVSAQENFKLSTDVERDFKEKII
jgi:hypothetical protein